MFDFLTIKKSVESLQQRYAELQTEIVDVQTKLNRTRVLSINKSDLPELIDQWIKRSAEGFTSAVGAHLTRNRNSGMNPLGDFGFFSAVEKNNNGELSARAMDSAMCAVFGGQIKTALITVFNAMAWPDEGLPKAKRAIEVERLEKLSQSLYSEIDELIKKADEAGIKLDMSGHWQR